MLTTRERVLLDFVRCSEPIGLFPSSGLLTMYEGEIRRFVEEGLLCKDPVGVPYVHITDTGLAELRGAGAG